jgi:hypothetical protein
MSIKRPGPGVNLKFFQKIADIYREYRWTQRSGHLTDEKIINLLMRLERYTITDG